MIFLTVGAQMPFDRLVRSVDRWAGLRGVPVFAQIGETPLVPVHLTWTARLGSEDFRARLEAAPLVVGHAGMGTIISAFEFRKPAIVLPRRGHLGETRNDHQVATARSFADRKGIYAAFDESELLALLDDREALCAPDPVASEASEGLLRALREFSSGRP